MMKDGRDIALGSAERHRAVVGMAAMAAILTFASQSLAEEPQAGAAGNAGALARATQNPVAAMISVPFQNNMNFGYGPNDHIQNVLNIQPVVPFSLNEDWNLVTRTVLPVISQPGMAPGEGTTFGLGATQFSGFLSPAQTGRLIWGAGAVVQAPTTTDQALGSNIWGGGPSFVALTMTGPWVVGGLVNNIWSAGGAGRNQYNTLTMQPFVNYNFASSPGTYMSFSPIITSNWEAESGQQWTVPLGLALGQILRIGQQPINAQLGAYYNAIRPDIGPEWQLRFQIQFLFPR
jgi:hypothetical protein